jgi:hypothetical protein
MKQNNLKNTQTILGKWIKIRRNNPVNSTKSFLLLLISSIPSFLYLTFSAVRPKKPFSSSFSISDGCWCEFVRSGWTLATASEGRQSLCSITERAMSNDRHRKYRNWILLDILVRISLLESIAKVMFWGAVTNFREDKNLLFFSLFLAFPLQICFYYFQRKVRERTTSNQTSSNSPYILYFILICLVNIRKVLV